MQDHYDRFRNYEITEEQYKTEYPNLLNQLSLKERFIVRFHPIHLTASRDLFFDLNMIMDFELFDFKQYDKIYVTTRSPVDRVCSLYVANRTGVWTYTRDSTEKPRRDLPVFEINDDFYSKIKFSIRDDLIYERLRDFFDRNSISYETVDYDDAITYARNNNLPIDSVSHIKTGYDYSKLFQNYDEIKSLFDKANIAVRKTMGLL